MTNDKDLFQYYLYKNTTTLVWTRCCYICVTKSLNEPA